MGLKELIDKNILKASKHFYYSSLAFITAKSLDVLSTSIGFIEHGDNVTEVNNFGSYLIEQFGTDEGLFAYAALTVPPVLAATYCLNKIFENKPHPPLKEMGSLLNYGFSGGLLYAAINNFAIYFSH